jgi:phosphomannomutase
MAHNLVVSDEPMRPRAVFRPARPGRPIHPCAVRAYDIRGVAGRDVTAEGVRRLGFAYAALARSRGLRRIAVGRDGRLSSPGLERALVTGLVDGGMSVLRIGLGPTPKLAFAVRALGLDGGLMVTASHNPPNENGIKLLLGAERIHGAALAALVGSSGSPAPGGAAVTVDVSDAYLDALAGAATALRPLKVAWDCGNGATGPMVEQLVRRLPGEHLVLNGKVDGRFPNHHPDPAVAANLSQLQAAVRRGGCDIGFAFDGDGDRIGVVDGSGEPVWSDHLLLFLARDLLARRPGAAVIADVKSSRLLFDGVAAAGGRAVMAPSGYVLVREAMRRQGALLAGELSGHIFFSDEWDGTDDALYAAIRTLAAVSRPGRALADFRRSLPATFATPEMRIPTPRARAVIDQIARLLGRPSADPAMGVRETSADGWWLVRASGTEAKITCRCEAGDPEALERLKGVLRARLQTCGVEPPAELMVQETTGAGCSPSNARASR